MVLTITVVGNGQSNGPGGHTVLSPNELAQLMSGQTVTGLLNPDGSITLNSGVMTTQQLSAIPTTMQNGVANVSNATGSSGYQQPRLQMDQLNTLPTNSITNLQAIPNDTGLNNGSTITANNNNAQTNQTQKKTGQKRLTAKQKLAQQQQQQQQQQSQQQLQQIPDTRHILSNPSDQTLSQQHQVVATVQLPNGQIGQLIAPPGGQIWSPSAINLQQLSMAVAAATGSMPQSMSIPSANSSGQSGQQDNSPSMQQQQQQQNTQAQQSQMQSIQMQPGNQQQSLNNPNQQQVMTTMPLPNNQIGQVMGRPGQSQIWSGGPISLTQLTALAQQGVVQLSPVQGVPTNGPNGQRVMEMIPQSTIQGLMNQNGQPIQTMPITSGGQYVTQDPNDPSKWQVVSSAPMSVTPNTVNVQSTTPTTTSNMLTGGSNNEQNVASSRGGPDSNNGNYGNQYVNTNSNQNPIMNDSAQSGQPQRKLKRLACTCPNCRDGDNSRSGGDKKKQHICHFPDCNKVYGKTSHLRAHLRWHSGERPYVCSWSFCGKKFTRSDELQRHRRTHTGEKRFQCPECLKRFMRSDHLSKHLKTHMSTKKSVGGQQQDGEEESELVNLPSSQVKVEVL